MEIKTGHIKCSSCGAPLSLPEGTLKTRFKCPFCSVENIVLNDDITTGGMNHELDEAAIHKNIIEIVSTAPFPPYDIYENLTVKEVNKLIIPAHWFIGCTGIGTLQYEKGITREFNEISFSDDDSSNTYTRTDWHPMSMTVSDIRDYIISANDKYDNVIKDLYGDIRSPLVKDAEELTFSEEAVDVKFNMSEASVLGKTLKELVDKTVEIKGFESVDKDSTRNIRVDGIIIQRAETRKISVGIYEIILDYKGKEYRIYISNDGNNFTFDELPNDEKSEALVNEKTKEAADADSHLRNGLIIAICILVGFGILTFAAVVGIFLLMIAGILLIIFIPIEKKYKEKKKMLEDTKNDIEGGFAKIKEEFINNKVALKGALSHLSGHPEAF